MDAADDPITAAVELALLEEWFATVQFDKESPGLPPMAAEEDDEVRSKEHGAAIQRWFSDMTEPIPRHADFEFKYAHQDTAAWSFVDLESLGMDQRTAYTIISKESNFRQLFGETRAGTLSKLKKGGNPFHGKDGKFASKPGASTAKIVSKVNGANNDDGGNNSASGKLSDEEFEKRTKLVENSIGLMMKSKQTTDHTETLPGGAWKPERDRVHREIADELYAKAADVPNEGKALIAGGLGGAGKTTVLTKFAKIDTKKYLTINPDDIKEILAERNLIPEVPGAPQLSPMERAALVHEESSRIAHMIAAKAYQDKKNVIWDITMSSEGSVRSRMTALKKSGYQEVGGVFVDIPVEVSVKRAMGRYRSGIDKYNEGRGKGGRYVPPAIIRAQRTSSGDTINRGVFDGLRSDFDSWAVYDNSVDGRNPELIDKGGS